MLPELATEHDLEFAGQGPGFEESGPLAKAASANDKRALPAAEQCTSREGHDAKDHENRHSD